MYNRYIPQPDGSYQRKRVQEPRPTANHLPPTSIDPPQKSSPSSNLQPQHVPCQNQTGNGSLSDFFRQFLPSNFETGDLIIVLLLLLMAGDCSENQNTALLTLVLYFFM